MTQPSNPYGTDLWIGPIHGNKGVTVLDIDPGGRVVSGIDVLAQSIVMRQTTPTGSLLGAPNDCFDIRQWVSDGLTVTQLQQLQSYIQSQLLRDQRVIAATALASYSFITSLLTVVETIQSTLGPFTLTLNVSQVTFDMLINQ